MAVASFGIPQNRAENPIPAMFVISLIFVSAVGGAVFGGGAYVAITALGATWDAAIARMRGRLRGHR